MSEIALIDNENDLVNKPEEEAAKDGEYNYLLCGDSISRGIIYDEKKGKYVMLSESYPKLVQNKLKGVIHNAARFGNTILRASSRFHNDVLIRKPDVVIIEFGGNDCDFNWDEIAKSPYEKHNPKTDFNIFQKSLKSFIDSLNSTGIIPVLMSLPPLDADRYFKWISKNSTSIADKILAWLGSISKIYWWQERYSSAITNIAQETRTRLIDIRGAFLKCPDFRQFLCIDGIHPNNKGHILIADKILEYVTNNYKFLLREDGAYNTVG